MEELRATTNLKRVDLVSILGNYVDNIQELLDRLVKSTNHKPELLQEILRKNANSIFWYDGFVNGLQAIIEKSPFDFVILDADLPIDDNLLQDALSTASPKTKEAISKFRQTNVFPQSSFEAGFTLYFYLIEQGFSLDRIVFLSAHVDKAEEITEAFVKAKATPPKIFAKNKEEDVNRFLDILKVLSRDKYVKLRRGILDGCQYILDNLYKLPAAEFIQFNQFLQEGEAEHIVNDMQDYLKILRDFFLVPNIRFFFAARRIRHSYAARAYKQGYLSFQRSGVGAMPYVTLNAISCRSKNVTDGLQTQSRTMLWDPGEPKSVIPAAPIRQPPGTVRSPRPPAVAVNYPQRRQKC